MTSSAPGDLLSLIDSPADLRSLPRFRLPELAGALRALLIDSVTRTGGHLAANLGVVELTLALHYCLDTPRDRLIFDVGHQAYTHKILTGRRAGMNGLRTRGGLSGFTRREESEHDPFGAGHSSTSISAALGMAIADRLQGRARRHVAIIGDGALTAGQAFEALNHAGTTDANLLVVLNDNEMSISPNVGALTEHLTRLRTMPVIDSLRAGSRALLRPLAPLNVLLEQARSGLKGALGVDSLFEHLGFAYYGPIDGHDLPLLLETLTHLRDRDGPTLLHVVTRKGRGLPEAETDPTRYHGVGAGTAAATTPGQPPAPSATERFGQWLCQAARSKPRLVAITPAMKEGSGLVDFAERYPGRFFDVGIAEQHAVTLAGGMACAGLEPVVAIYSTFLQRGYDQVIHDIALQSLNVLFAIDRAGLVGPDGPTHAGVFDLAFLQCVPNLTIMAPADSASLLAMLEQGLDRPGPVAVRYPRGALPTLPQAPPVIPDRAAILRHGQAILIVAVGSMVEAAMHAAESLDATLIDLRFVKPLDVDTLAGQAEQHPFWITIEEGAIKGGVGQALVRELQERGLAGQAINLGVPDRFIEHGSRAQCLADCGLDPESIAATIRRFTDGRDDAASPDT
ncbi:MAG: 1-deoxy-D-xylulose-5-phosphate synthase [Halothiobacillaceae bacterium]